MDRPECSTLQQPHGTTNNIQNVYRIVNNKDIVPSLPPSNLGYVPYALQPSHGWGSGSL